MLDLSVMDAAALGRALKRMAVAVQSATGASGVTMMQNNFAAGGQVVFHVHMHLVPRFPNDHFVGLQRGNTILSGAERTKLTEEIRAKLDAECSLTPTAETPPVATSETKDANGSNYLGTEQGNLSNADIFLTEYAVATLDLHPAVQGHTLLMPLSADYHSLLEMPEEVIANITKELPRLTRAVRAVTNCEGITIVLDAGPIAGQTFSRPCFQIIPRHRRDNVILLPPQASKPLLSEPPILAAIRAQVLL